MYQLFYTWISQNKFTSINLFTCWTVLVCLFTWYKRSYLLSWYKYTQFWLSFSKLLVLLLQALLHLLSYYRRLLNVLFKLSSYVILLHNFLLFTLGYSATKALFLQWVILLPKHTHLLSYYRFNIHILTVIAGTHIVSAIFNTQRMKMYI